MSADSGRIEKVCRLAGSRWALSRMLIAVLVCTGVLMFSSDALAQAVFDVEVNAKPERASRHDVVKFQISVYVSGNSRVKITDKPDLGDFEVLSGPSVVNSLVRRNSQSAKRSLYEWRLKPKRSGRLTIGPATVTAGSRERKTRSVNVDVADTSGPSTRLPTVRTPGGGTGTQPPPATTLQRDAEVAKPGDDFFLVMNMEAEEAWLGEPVYVSYELYRPPTVYEMYDVSDPDFKGFWPRESPYNSYGSKRNERKAGKIYDVEDVRSYVLIPIETGKLKVSPVLVHVPVTAGFNAERHWIASPSQDIRIKALPPNPPPGFDVTNVGAGVTMSAQTRVSGAAGPKAMRVGDSMVVSLMVSGEGLIDQMRIQPPELDNFVVFGPEIEDTTQEVSSETVRGTQRVKLTFIPTREGVQEIPAIKWPYFDFQKGEYVTLTAGPWPIEVSGKAPGADTFLEHVAQSEVAASEEIAALAVTARDMQPGEWHRGEAQYGQWWFFLLLFLPPAGYVALLIGGWSQRKRRAGAAKRRSTGAHKKCHKSLKSAGKHSSEPGKFYGELASALQIYVKEAFGVSARALTGDGLVGALASEGVPRPAGRRLAKLLSRAEEIRYAPSPEGAEVDADLEQARRIVDEMENCRDEEER